MGVGQVALLELRDESSITRERWQDTWLEATITWDSQQWQHRPFSWDILGGSLLDDQASITIPRLPSMNDLIRRALAGPWLAVLRVYQFDDEQAGIDSTPSNLILIRTCWGQVVAASGSHTEITLRLGSALAPIGAQFPPRSASTALIGVPCIL